MSPPTGGQDGLSEIQSRGARLGDSEQDANTVSSSSTNRDEPSEKNRVHVDEKTNDNEDDYDDEEDFAIPSAEDIGVHGDLEEGGNAPVSDKGKQPEGGGGLIARVLSRASTRHLDPGPPPDGGLQAWIAVGCTHLVIMDTWGVINSFGSFQTYYTTLLDKAPSDIAWIGSFQIFLLFFIGTFTGRLTDAGYFKHLLVTGSILQLVGIFTTAQGTQYWQIFLSQGVVMGLGNGCIFCPALATMSTYFSKRRSLAIGIAATGSATGGLVFPSIVRQLLPSIGFPWTMRVIGFVQLATLLVACIGLRTRLPPRSSGKLIEWSAFREREYAFYAAGSFFVCSPCLSPLLLPHPLCMYRN